MINKYEFQAQLTMAEKMLLGILTVIFVFSMTLPRTIYAAEPLPGQNTAAVIASASEPDLLTQRFEELAAKKAPLPAASQKAINTKNYRQPVKYNEMYVPSSAYSSDVWQTDSTPCITADGFNVCANGQENVVAANFLPFGTKIQIPDIYGDRIFTVHDRMNKRYYKKIDIWMTSRARAIQYGVRTVKIRILSD